MVFSLHLFNRQSYGSAQHEVRCVLLRLDSEALMFENIQVHFKVAYFMTEFEARGRRPKSAIEFTVQELLKYQNTDVKRIFTYDEFDNTEDKS